MLTVPQIKVFLQDRRVDKVAKATGLHYNTVYQVKTDPDANPTFRVAKALSDYFEAQLREAENE